MPSGKRRKSLHPLSPVKLKSLADSKAFMEEMIKSYYMGKLKDKRARTISFMMQTYIGFLKLEGEQRWTAQLEKLNLMVEGKLHAKN